MKEYIKLLIFCLSIVSLKGQTQNDSAQAYYAHRISLDSINGIYIPKDLNDCFVQLDSFWNDSTKNVILSWTEKEFTSKSHFGIGLWIRNNWSLWGGSRLGDYFIKKKIYHPDDMSGIIITSYHRYLRNEPIKLNKQIKFHHEYWEANQKDSPEFEATTRNKKTYNSIDSALAKKENIIEISLTNYSKLPKEIKKFHNLKSISIEKCPELNLTKTIALISYFQHLEELSFFENGFEKYPQTLGSLSSLKDLWIDSDSLKYLPNSIRDLINLKSISVTECPNLNLDSLISQLTPLDSLKEIWLEGNNLVSIPQSINQLNQIEDLWLSNNSFKEIPIGVKQMQNLKYLGLFDNNIDSLNIAKGELPNLENINLCYNNFNVFPIELVNLKNLKRVTIWHSEISIIPSNIDGLKNLEYLNLTGNNLSEEQKHQLRNVLNKTELKL